MNGFKATVQRILEGNYALDLDPDYKESDFDPSDFDTGEVPNVDKHGDSQISVGSYKAVERALIEAYMTKRSLLIYGDAGVGKSTVVKSVCKKVFAPHEKREYVEWRGKGSDTQRKKEMLESPDKYFCLIDQRGAELEPVDLRGIEMPNSDAPYLNPKIPMWIYLMAQPGSSGVLFLDELNQSSMQVLNAMYGVVLDKQAGEVQFNDSWTIVAAGNLGSEFINSNELPQALTRRFGVIMLIPDPVGWAEWAEDNGVDPLVTSYVKSKPEENFYMKSESPSDPMPDPRNLTSFSDAIKKIKHHYYTMKKRGIRPDVSYAQALAESAARICGDNWAKGFIQFYTVFSKLKWEELHGTKEKYRNFETQNIYAYLVFIFQKLNNLINSETELSKKFGTAAMNYKAGKLTTEDKVVIDEMWKVAGQFWRIANNLFHNRNEYLTTLINLLNSHDRTITVNLLAAAKMHTTDPAVVESRSAISEVAQINSV